MKKICLLGWCIGISLYGQAQDSLRAKPLIGFELLRPLIYSVIPPDRRFVEKMLVIEPTMYFPTRKPGQFTIARVGYSQYTNERALGNIDLSASGVYVKVGRLHRHPEWVGWGVLGTVSVFQSRGVYRFSGPVFGDYEGLISPLTQVAVGAEGIMEINIPLGRSWSFSMPARVNLAVLPNHRDFVDPFVLGNGYMGVFGKATALRIGCGLNLYLLYQL